MSGSFTPGARSTPEDTSTPGAGDPHSFGDIAGVEAARHHERQPSDEIFEKPPVEHRTETARPGGIFRRARVEQNAVGHGGIVRGESEVAFWAIATAFITGSPKRCLMS